MAAMACWRSETLGDPAIRYTSAGTATLAHIVWSVKKMNLRETIYWTNQEDFLFTTLRLLSITAPNYISLSERHI